VRIVWIDYGTKKREGERLEIYIRELGAVYSTRSFTISAAEDQLGQVYIFNIRLTVSNY
jgi:hypothetical protein